MLETMFELSVNLIETLIITDFISKFFGYKDGGSKSKGGFFIAWIIFFTELSLLNYLTSFEGAAVVIYIGTLILYATIFLKGGNVAKILMCTLIIAITLVIAISTNLLISYIGNIDAMDLINNLNAERGILVAASKLVLFYVTRIILRFKINASLSLRDGLLLIGMPAMTIVSMSLMMFTAITHSDVKAEMLISMVSVIFTNMIVYYLFVKISRDNDLKIQYEVLAQNYKDELKNASNVRALSNSLQGLKHDLKNHLITLQLYLAEGKNLEARAYIEKMIDDKIEGIAPRVKTGNDALDAILNAKRAVCKKEEIFLEMNIGKSVLDFMGDDDICILLGNLLDNGIEAAKHAEEKSIQLKIQKQGAYSSVFVANSIAESVLKRNSDLKTSKSDQEHHGYGLKNVNAVVKKYDGMVEHFEREGGEAKAEFCCDILLQSSKQFEEAKP